MRTVNRDNPDLAAKVRADEISGGEEAVDDTGTQTTLSAGFSSKPNW
jgi:hypothetical protein